MKEGKHLKRGIFLGVIFIIGSVEILCSSSYDLNAYFVCFIAIALVVGVLQLSLSINFKLQKYKAKVLFFVFFLELLYYICAIIYAENYFVSAIGSVMIMLIILTLVHLYSIITKGSK